MPSNRTKRSNRRWSRVNQQTWSLAYEASSVVLLRMLTMTFGGPAARSEAQRMVEEKVKAALALQALALTGGLGPTPDAMATKTVSHYRKAVRANRRRLLEKLK